MYTLHVILRGQSQEHSSALTPIEMHNQSLPYSETHRLGALTIVTLCCQPKAVTPLQAVPPESFERGSAASASRSTKSCHNILAMRVCVQGSHKYTSDQISVSRPPITYTGNQLPLSNSTTLSICDHEHPRLGISQDAPGLGHRLWEPGFHDPLVSGSQPRRSNCRDHHQPDSVQRRIQRLCCWVRYRSVNPCLTVFNAVTDRLHRFAWAFMTPIPVIGILWALIDVALCHYSVLHPVYYLAESTILAILSAIFGAMSIVFWR